MALCIYLHLICLWLLRKQIVLYHNHGYNIGSGFRIHLKRENKYKEKVRACTFYFLVYIQFTWKVDWALDRSSCSCCCFCFNILLYCLFSLAFFGFILNLCPQHGQLLSWSHIKNISHVPHLFWPIAYLACVESLLMAIYFLQVFLQAMKYNLSWQDRKGYGLINILF